MSRCVLVVGRGIKIGRVEKERLQSFITARRVEISWSCWLLDLSKTDIFPHSAYFPDMWWSHLQHVPAPLFDWHLREEIFLKGENGPERLGREMLLEMSKSLVGYDWYIVGGVSSWAPSKSIHLYIKRLRFLLFISLTTLFPHAWYLINPFSKLAKFVTPAAWYA